MFAAAALAYRRFKSYATYFDMGVLPVTFSRKACFISVRHNGQDRFVDFSRYEIRHCSWNLWPQDVVIVGFCAVGVIDLRSSTKDS